MSQSSAPDSTTHPQKGLISREVYNIVRAYIEHEDQLVNYRMTWLLAINGLLFAAFGWVLSKQIDNMTKVAQCIDTAPDKKAVHIYFLFVVILCLVGVFVSYIGQQALDAAHDATSAIKEICVKAYASGELEIGYRKKHDVFRTNNGEILPMVTGGGVKTRRDGVIRYGMSATFIAAWIGIFMIACWYQFLGNSSPISR